MIKNTHVINAAKDLQVENLSVYYQSLQAVSHISFKVGDGELVALIGANGAGKSSILKALMGLAVCDCQQLLFKNQSLLKMPTYQRVNQGMALVPEGRGIFPELTVYENLLMGAYARRESPTVTLSIEDSIEADLNRVYILFPQLLERAKQHGGSLSGGEQQMLAIGRALMSRPSLLLLDEPSMGLAPLIVKHIFQIIEQIWQSGTSILLVEQNAAQALKISQRAYVLESGHVVAEGKSEDLLQNSQVKSAYLGV